MGANNPFSRRKEADRDVETGRTGGSGPVVGAAQVENEVEEPGELLLREGLGEEVGRVVLAPDLADPQPSCPHRRG